MQAIRRTAVDNSNSFWAQARRLPKIESHYRGHANLSDNYPIPKLKLLDQIVERILSSSTPIDFKKIIIVAVQHNLETTVTLFKALQRFGIKNIYTLGKCYSDSEVIVNAMYANGIELIRSSRPNTLGHYSEAARHDIDLLWKTCLEHIKNIEGIERIIILDDGGSCLMRTPLALLKKYKLAGVEQTRGGLYNHTVNSLPFPIVNVALSALKRYIEPPFIAKAVLRKVDLLLKEYHLINETGLPVENTVMGVAGIGAIGEAIAKYLCSLGYIVNIYDKDENIIMKASIKGAYRVDSLKDLFIRSRCIFGCTGVDLTADLALDEIIKNDTLLISCSSEEGTALD